MARKKTAKKEDWNSLFNDLKRRVEAFESTRKDPILKDLLIQYERQVNIANQLYIDIETRGTVVLDARTGKLEPNGSVMSLNKTATLLSKLSEQIRDATRAVATDAEEKSW